jgi:predicted PurR-regulated permease PerM
MLVIRVRLFAVSAPTQILWPFYGAILWGIVGAIVFAPLYRRLSQSMREKRSLAAIAMVLLVVMTVILPLMLSGASLAQEASGVYGRVQSGELDTVRFFQQILDALPLWVINLLDRFGLGSVAGMQDKLSAGLLKSS